MKRLTQKDEQWNWCLKGMAWAQLYVGRMISREVHEKLYGALWKLMEYEDTGLTPDEITDGKMLTGWVPVEEQLPEPLKNVLVYYDTGRIDIDCWYHDGDYLYHSLGNALAWMPLPEPFRPQIGDLMEG